MAPGRAVVGMVAATTRKSVKKVMVIGIECLAQWHECFEEKDRHCWGRTGWMKTLKRRE